MYKHYASAVSVLTDEKYFQGKFEYLPQVRDVVSQPVLCKDFMISEYQVYLARYYQADAILLMLSVVNDETYRVLADLAHSLGMGVLTETSNEVHGGNFFYFLWRELCHGHMGKGAFRPVGYSSGDKRHVAQGQQG